jgi:hypothetical protein
MRKRAIPSLILLVLLSLNFTSCGQNNESDSHLMAMKNTVIVISSADSKAEKIAAIVLTEEVENPGEGNFYDDLGTLDRSTHLVRGEGLNTDSLMEKNPNPG